MSNRIVMGVNISMNAGKSLRFNVEESVRFDAGVIVLI